MTYNDLTTKLTNIKIALGDMMSQIKFTNSEIVILGDYTVGDIVYENGRIRFVLDKLEETDDQDQC